MFNFPKKHYLEKKEVFKNSFYFFILLFYFFNISLGESIFRTWGLISLKNEHFFFPLSLFLFFFSSESISTDKG